MGKNKTAIIILISALALILVAYFWYSNIEKPKYKWYETYRNDGKQPYDTYLISEMLEKYFPQKKFTVLRKPLHTSLPQRTKDANYVFIGTGMYLDSLSEIKLLEFVARGNNAFLSIPEIPYSIQDTLQLMNCEDYYYLFEYSVDSVARLNFFDENFKTDSSYNTFYRYVNDTNFYSWSHFNDTCVGSDFRFEKYGKLNNNMVNYARIAFGRGYFYIHTTPLAFSNHNLLDKRAVEYASKVFSYLPEGDIYWDEFSKIPVEFGNQGGQLKWGKSPLKFILSQPALKTAWYLILALAVLYLLFRAKRRQRIIPVLIPNTNTSLEFAQTIGRIYYLQNDHKKLAMLKMKLFLEAIRNRYGISTAQHDELFFVKLAQKSQVPQNEIEKLFESYKAIAYLEKISENMLINFNSAIDNFHKQAK